jgi:isopenicillin-N N-acyltransferase-like protein
VRFAAGRRRHVEPRRGRARAAVPLRGIRLDLCMALLPHSGRRLAKLAAHTATAAVESFPYDPIAAAAEPSPNGYVHLVGSPRERGQAHGMALASQMQTVFDAWRMQMHAIFGNGSGDTDSMVARAWCRSWCDDFISATDFEGDIETWAPGLLDEVGGMAEATGISYNEMLVFQCMDEYWYHGKAIAEPWQVDSPRPEHCTAFALSAHESSGAPAIVAQTMDLESFRDGFQVVLRVNAVDCSLPEQLIFSHAGMVGLCGVNSAGVAIACNNLSQLNHSTRGLPVAFVVRAILQRSVCDTEHDCFLSL